MLIAPVQTEEMSFDKYKFDMTLYLAQEDAILLFKQHLVEALPDQALHELEVAFPMGGASLVEIYALLMKKYGQLTKSDITQLKDQLSIPCETHGLDKYLNLHLRTHQILEAAHCGMPNSDKVDVFQAGLRHLEWTHMLMNTFIYATNPADLSIEKIAAELQLYYDRVAPQVQANALKVSSLPAAPSPLEKEILDLKAKNKALEKKLHNKKSSSHTSTSLPTLPPLPTPPPDVPRSYGRKAIHHCSYHNRMAAHTSEQCYMNPANSA